MIFVDSNIPMYVVGRPHPYKKVAAEALLSASESGTQLVTDAEVLQEIMHRYSAIKRISDGDDAMSLLLSVVDRVYPIDQFDIAEARQLMSEAEDLSARDLLHWAVMRRYGVMRILTFDRDFDRCAGIQRLC